MTAAPAVIVGTVAMTVGIVAETEAAIVAVADVADALDAGAVAAVVLRWADRVEEEDATSLRRNMLPLRVIVIRAAMTIAARMIAEVIGEQTVVQIAAPALRSRASKTTLFCRANRWRSIAAALCLPRRWPRLWSKSPKSVNRILIQRPRAQRLACRQVTLFAAAFLAACPTGC